MLKINKVYLFIAISVFWVCEFHQTTGIESITLIKNTCTSAHVLARWWGLAFPNLIKYYQVTQLRAIASWSTQRSFNRCTEIEKLWLAPIQPNSLLWSANAEVAPSQMSGTMSHLRLLWRKLSRQYVLSSEKSLLISFMYNSKMHASLTYSMSFPWTSRNLFHFCHLVDSRSRKLLSFTELQEIFGLPRQVFYR